MFHNCQNNQPVFQNHVASCCHAVVNGTEMVRGIALPQRDLKGKRPSEPAGRSKRRASASTRSDRTVTRDVLSRGSMSGAAEAMRVHSSDRMTRALRAGDPPAAIWATLVISRALSS